MKKLFFALIFCTAMLCGCSAKAGNEISETALPETSSVTVTTEISAAVTEAETTATTTDKRETTVTKPAEEEIILTPIPSKEPFEIMSCKIIEDIAVDNEEDFYDKEVLKRAKEICFEKANKQIEDYNDTVERGIFNGNKVKSSEDITFSCGISFDFDGDGSNEYVIALDFRPANPMGGGLLILMDGSEYAAFAKDCGDIKGFNTALISSGEYYFPMVTYYAGQWYSMDIYSFENDKPKDVLDYHKEAHGIAYENGVFYLEVKYETPLYPFILCGDGVFRQLGREKITREDFEAHVQNGGKYLDSLFENGEEITDIYTYGYCNYELCGEYFHYDLYSSIYRGDKDIFLTQRSDYKLDDFNFFTFTDEVIYGCDVWAVKPVHNNN